MECTHRLVHTVTLTALTRDALDQLYCGRFSTVKILRASIVCTAEQRRSVSIQAHATSVQLTEDEAFASMSFLEWCMCVGPQEVILTVEDSAFTCEYHVTQSDHTCHITLSDHTYRKAQRDCIVTLRALTTTVLQADTLARNKDVIVVEIGACDGSSFDPVHAFIKVGHTSSHQEGFLHGCALYLVWLYLVAHCILHGCALYLRITIFLRAFVRACMRACMSACIM